MRKHHNKLFYGKYRYKVSFKMPWAPMMYPTTDENLQSYIDGTNNDVPFLSNKVWRQSSDVIRLAKFIKDNRLRMKFRLQQTKSMFYTDKKLANELVINFWEDWVESKVVDPKYANLDENTIGCSRLPHGKYQYQIYLKKKLAWQISEEKRTALLKFLDHNVENVYVANGGLIDWLEGKDTWYPASYFYVTDERYLSPLYVIAGDFIEKVIQFKKVKNAGNKKLKDNKIFGENTIVESVVQKSLWGSPVPKKCFFRVKKIDEEYCICEEVGEADGKAHKIKYVNILTIDGQEPNELAAVYGLGPKPKDLKDMPEKHEKIPDTWPGTFRYKNIVYVRTTRCASNYIKRILIQLNFKNIKFNNIRDTDKVFTFIIDPFERRVKGLTLLLDELKAYSLIKNPQFKKFIKSTSVAGIDTLPYYLQYKNILNQTLFLPIHKKYQITDLLKKYFYQHCPELLQIKFNENVWKNKANKIREYQYRHIKTILKSNKSVKNTLDLDNKIWKEAVSKTNKDVDSYLISKYK